jgi:hypothetical protein
MLSLIFQPSHVPVPLRPSLQRTRKSLLAYSPSQESFSKPATANSSSSPTTIATPTVSSLYSTPTSQTSAPSSTYPTVSKSQVPSQLHAVFEHSASPSVYYETSYPTYNYSDKKDVFVFKTVQNVVDRIRRNAWKKLCGEVCRMRHC